MSKVKINKLTTLVDTKYLKMYNADYTNKNGDKRTWSIASRKNLSTLNNKFFNNTKDTIDAVIIVAKHIEDNKLVIIRQFRIPLNGYIYELPAGLIDSGEDFETTVRRELKEETGLDLIEIDYSKTKSRVYLSAGMTDESAALVYCSCKGTLSTEFLEPDEDIEVMLVSIEDAKILLQSDENMDIRALMALQHFIWSQK